MYQGPLAGRYFAVAAMVMFALIPYLALSAALGPLTPVIAKQLHTSLQTMSLGSGAGPPAAVHPKTPTPHPKNNGPGRGAGHPRLCGGRGASPPIPPAPAA